MKKGIIKVGDEVRRTAPGGAYPKGYKFIVKEVINAPDDKALHERVKCSQGGVHSPEWLEIIEALWIPKYGDYIEVANGLSPFMERMRPKEVENFTVLWRKRRFVRMINGRYLCKANEDNNDHQFYAYEFGREIKTHYTITLENGEKVQISKESYDAIRKGALK